MLFLSTIVILIAMGVSTQQDTIINKFGGVINTIFAPMQRIFSATGQKSESLITFLIDISAVRKENEELKALVEKLEQENQELLTYKGEIRN